MFQSLNARLLSSYVFVLLICLALVGLGLLIFLRTSPLWTRSTNQRLEEAERATMRLLLQEAARGNLASQNVQSLMVEMAQEHMVRILLLDSRRTVRFDTGEEWTGQDFSQSIRPQPQPQGQGPPQRFQGTFTAPDGRRWLFISQVFPTVGEQRQLLVFTSPPIRLLALGWYIENLIPPLIRAGLVALVLSVLLALLISRSVARPLRKVADAAEAIARGETETRAPISGPTEVQALAQSFNTMVDQVEATQQSQRDFVANVSHELKTPLTSIQGFSQALLDGTASTPQATQRAARVIYEETERMRRMVNELLTLARFDAGQMALTHEPVELKPLLQNCIEKLTPQAQTANVKLALTMRDHIVVTGDADRLAQVFTNLIDNGITHTPAGGQVTVAVRRPADSPTVEITVTDTGDGIPAEDLSRVFERFYQVDKSRQRKRGVGLGLAITKEIVEAHDGSITAESVIGLGSRFTVRLPI